MTQIVDGIEKVPDYPPLELITTDRKLLDGFTDYAALYGIVDPRSLEPAQSFTFADAVHGFGSRVVNRRIHIVKGRGSRLPDEIVPPESSSADHQAASNATHQLLDTGQSVTVNRSDGTAVTISSFPISVIARNMQAFFQHYGYEAEPSDHIRQTHRMGALQAAHAELYEDGHVLSRVQQHYSPDQRTHYTMRAQAYPEIAMYTTLRDIYRSQGHAVAADSIDVLLAACGTRLYNLAQQRPARYGSLIIDLFDH